MEKITREDILLYAEAQYGTEPEYVWEKFPSYAVLRHKGGRKWFALIMNVPEEKLGLPGEGLVDVVNVKCDFFMIGSLRETKGYLPAYHMSKGHWITILLDGTVSQEEVFDLLDRSYDLTK